MCVVTQRWYHPFVGSAALNASQLDHSKKYQTPSRLKILTLVSFLKRARKSNFALEWDYISFYCTSLIDRDQTSALNTNDIGKNYTLGTLIAKLNECSYFQGVGSMLATFEEKHLQNSEVDLIQAKPTIISLSYSKQICLLLVDTKWQWDLL